MTTLILHSMVYLLVGAFTGLVAGLFGIGGGLVIVPSLVFVFQQTATIPNNLLMHVAVGTSLAVMIITSLSAARSHNQIDRILWPVFHKLWPGLISGTLSGSLIAAWVPTDWLKMFFGLFLFFVAIKMLLEKQVTHQASLPKPWIIILVCFLIGLLSGLLGVGGGILLVPFMVYCGINPRKIAGLSNSCAVTIASIGTLSFLITGLHETKALNNTLGYIYWPAVLLIGITSSLVAPLGATLHYKLPSHQLRYGFIILIILTALKMLT